MTSQQRDIDELLAEYSQLVADHGPSSPEATGFYERCKTYPDFEELAGTVRRLRETHAKSIAPTESPAVGLASPRFVVTALAALIVAALGIGLTFQWTKAQRQLAASYAAKEQELSETYVAKEGKLLADMNREKEQWLAEARTEREKSLAEAALLLRKSEQLYASAEKGKQQTQARVNQLLLQLQRCLPSEGPGARFPSSNDSSFISHTGSQPQVICVFFANPGQESGSTIAHDSSHGEGRYVASANAEPGEAEEAPAEQPAPPHPLEETPREGSSNMEGAAQEARPAPPGQRVSEGDASIGAQREEAVPSSPEEPRE